MGLSLKLLLPETGQPERSLTCLKQRSERMILPWKVYFCTLIFFHYHDKNVIFWNSISRLLSCSWYNVAKINCYRLPSLESYNKLIKTPNTEFALHCETFILALPLSKTKLCLPVNFRFVRIVGNKKRFRCCKAYAFACLVYVYIHTDSLPLERAT